MTTDPMNSPLPPDLAPIAAAMDALGEHERASAPVTLEDRLFMATRAKARGHAPTYAIAPAPTVRRLRFVNLSRMAAVVALAGAGVAIYLAQLPRPAVQPILTNVRVADISSLEEDVDMLLAMRTLGEGPEGTGQKIDELYLDAEAVRSSLKGDWSRTIPDEGSM